MKKNKLTSLSRSAKAVLLTVVLMWASGQTAMAQSNRAAKGTEQNLVQAAATKKTQAVKIRQGATVNPTVNRAVPGDKKVQPQSKEQLMFQRKQAADQGLPTAEFDKAIHQLNINQAN